MQCLRARYGFPVLIRQSGGAPESRHARESSVLGAHFRAPCSTTRSSNAIAQQKQLGSSQQRISIAQSSIGGPPVAHAIAL